MTYKELCKISFTKSLKNIISPNTKNIIRSAQRIVYELRNIFIEFLEWIFCLLYILTFPISSFIVFLIHKPILKNIEKKREEARNKILKKFYNNRKY